jgi:predicted nucleic acid-binding protein
MPGDASEYDRLNAALAALRELAHQLACPVVVVAERNRGSMKEGGMSASAGSRRFEYVAEGVLALERSDADAAAGGEVEVKLRVQKNRHGSPGLCIP